MSQTQATTLDDIAESIADLSTMVAGEFVSVRREMAAEFTVVRQEMTAETKSIRQDIAELRSGQRETNERLARLEDNGLEYANDIKALYEMIADLQKEIRHFTKDEKRRLADLEAFAMQVAEKTGIPYTPKPKLRS
jgi:uncharacterized coiled-coil DUF342 family protein